MYFTNIITKPSSLRKRYKAYSYIALLSSIYNLYKSNLTRQEILFKWIWNPMIWWFPIKVTFPLETPRVSLLLSFKTILADITSYFWWIPLALLKYIKHMIIFFKKQNKTTCRFSVFIYLIIGFCIAFEGLHVNDIVMAYLTPSTSLSTKWRFSDPDVKKEILPEININTLINNNANKHHGHHQWCC